MTQSLYGQMLRARFVGADARVGAFVGHDEVRLVGVVEVRHQAIVLAVGDRVVLVRVALCAAHGHAQEHRARRRDPVGHRVEAELEGVDAALLVQHRVAVEAGRHAVVGRRVGEHVSRELLDDELVERHVGVERADDPVSIRPDAARAVLLVAVAVGVAREVHPAAGLAFGVVRGRQQLVDESLVGVASLVGQERV